MCVHEATAVARLVHHVVAMNSQHKFDVDRQRSEPVTGVENGEDGFGMTDGDESAASGGWRCS